MKFDPISYLEKLIRPLREYHSVTVFSFLLSTSLHLQIKGWKYFDGPAGKFAYFFDALFVSVPLAFFAVLLLQRLKVQHKIIRFFIPYVIGSLSFLLYLVAPIHDKNIYNVVYTSGLFLTVHLLISLTSADKSGSRTQHFWHFNKILGLQAALSAIYSMVFYIGLLLAAYGVDSLFGLNVSNQVYKFAPFIFALMHTLTFLAELPTNGINTNVNTDYPWALRVFAVKVLLPLVVLYAIILYLYAFKILFELSLPKGTLSAMLLGLSGAGISAYLLLHPLAETESNKWIKTYNKIFYIGILPLILLLFLAVGRRIADYGFTESRYLVLITGIWLLSVAVYFVFLKQRRIEFILFSMVVFSIIGFFSPLNAINVSMWSQEAKWNGIIDSAMVQQNDSKKLSQLHYNQLTDIYRFFDDRKYPKSVLNRLSVDTIPDGSYTELENFLMKNKIEIVYDTAPETYTEKYNYITLDFQITEVPLSGKVTYFYQESNNISLSNTEENRPATFIYQNKLIHYTSDGIEYKITNKQIIDSILAQNPDVLKLSNYHTIDKSMSLQINLNATLLIKQIGFDMLSSNIERIEGFIVVRKVDDNLNPQ